MPAEPFKFDGELSPWKAEQIMRFCGKSALDVGCNSGDLVAYLNSKGLYSEGVDNSETLIQQARAKYPHLPFLLSPNIDQFADRQFETVVAWNVLEHIQDDEAALKNMIRIASKNVILSVPKEDDLSLPDSRVTYRPYVDPTHLHYYTPESMQFMLRKLGQKTWTMEHTTPVRPLLAYAKLGIPKALCSALDRLFYWAGKNHEVFHANLMVVIHL